MRAFLYGVGLQWKIDIRSKALLITCYIVPLLFFAIMGVIFTSINPTAKDTLIQSMTVMGVSMGAFIGLPPSIVETYASDIKKVYKANGVPMYLGLVTMFISAFIHLMIMSTIIFIVAPIAFKAAIPQNVPLYFASLAVFIAVSLSIGSVLGLLVKNQAKLTMFAQVIFLPSILLSGIMFPITMLPDAFETVSRIFPATWGFKLMCERSFTFGFMWPLLLIMLIALALVTLLLQKIRKE